MCPCISALHWVNLRTWFVMCGGRSSILHYGPLIKTNLSVCPDAEWAKARVRRYTKAIPHNYNS